MKSVTIDYERRRIGIDLGDGRSVEAPLDSGGAPSSISRSTYDAYTDELRLVLRNGEQVTLEVGTRATRGARPIVYLDQNQWILLARHRYAPEKLNSEQRAACAAVSALAARGDVILPLSGAHAVETARADGRWRHDLAMTMLSLSRGWQMLSPLKVRMLELGHDMTGSPVRRDEHATTVFGLKPSALYTAESSYELSYPDRLPPAAHELVQRLTWGCAFVETLLEDEIDDAERGRDLADRWARVHGEIARSIRGSSPEQARLTTHGCVLADLKADIARSARAAGMTQAEFDEWLAATRSTISRMPYIGRLEEVVYHRLRNPTAGWNRNHLNDVHFLCCAAGYADIVVCEKETADHLQRAVRRAAPGAEIHKSLARGWDALQSLSETPSETH